MYDMLEGLTVVEGSAFVAAPLGGMTLAQLGAEVIRFDPPGGGMDFRRWPLDDGGTSLYWAGLNKAKKSFAVDIRKPEGRELVTALICRPGPGNGLLLTNHPPGGPLDYDKLKPRRDDVIVLNVLGHFDGGTAVDYTVNCGVGYAWATGPRDLGRPVNNMLPAWDLATGATAATASTATVAAASAAHTRMTAATAHHRRRRNHRHRRHNHRHRHPCIWPHRPCGLSGGCGGGCYDECCAHGGATAAAATML